MNAGRREAPAREAEQSLCDGPTVVPCGVQTGLDSRTSDGFEGRLTPPSFGAPRYSFMITALTCPVWPGREVTRAVPALVSISAPFVTMFRRT